MELVYKNWNEVSISNYRLIRDILTDEARDEVSKNVGLLSVLCQVEEQEVWNLNVNDLNPLMKQIGWIGKFDFPKDIKFKKINIGGQECVIETDLQKMSIAQYVDFQNLYKEFDKNIGAILACFIIPKGKKYGEDYDTVEFAKTIEDNLSIVQSNAICFFFLKNWASSIRATATFLDWEIKKLKRKNKNNPQIAEIERKMVEMQAMYGSLL